MDEDEISYIREFGFEPLGYAQARGSERRYAFRTSTDLIVFRGVVLASLSGLLALNPDPNFWRKLFPKRGGRIDTAAAAAFLIRECQLTGLVDLPEEHMPRPAGRPKKGAKYEST
jgi:hypothetical protein